MRVEHKDLTAHFEIEVTESRLARQWASVESRLPGPALGGGLKWRVLAVVVPLFVLGGWLGWAERSRRPESGAVIESSDTPVAVQLRDGSSLELAAQTRLRVLRDQPSAVAVEVGDGRANFDVKHVAGRSFDVQAGAVSVRVIGTRFQVVKASRREGTEVEVAVKRGVVEVRRNDRDGEVRKLASGETWSVWIPAEPVSGQQKASHAHSVNGVNGADDSMHAAPAPVAPAPPTPNADQRSSALVAEALPQQVQPTAPAEPETQPLSAAKPNVRALFLRANVARRAGRIQDAATAYAELLKRFPRDSRAGVSAFELGRIRMDILGDSKGAAQAFTEALGVSRKSQFREDALARLAIASDASGDAEGCRSARTRYLTDYPAGVHTGSLSSLCGGSH